MADNWFYAQDCRTFGPFSEAQLKDLAVGGKLRPLNIVWKEGMTEGLVAATVNELFPKGQAKPLPAATAR